MNTKDQILAVAIKLFAQKGYHSTSIRDIATAAAVNSSMVGYYFHSKENLYLTIFESFRNDYLDQFENNHTGQKSGDYLLQFINESISFSLAHQNILLLFFTEQIFRINQPVWSAIEEIRLHHYKLFLDTIADQATHSDNLKNWEWKYFSLFNNLRSCIVAQRLDKQPEVALDLMYFTVEKFFGSKS